MSDPSRSDGSTAVYYQLPEGAVELQDLISHKNMNAQDGEIFRTMLRRLNSILKLKLKGYPKSGTCNGLDNSRL